MELKPEHIAEQMTLLDAQLFTNIEIPEVLIWTQEQKEEKSPNLTRFTEHFNKMSFWSVVVWNVFRTNCIRVLIFKFSMIVGQDRESSNKTTTKIENVM